ncbi:MAG: flagellar biosynthesis protein FliQ [Desulfovibrionaceae bacterium]|nr:flagellar biosynthesis protein FliQ [Desulfovibrionaceae bacterium]
MTPEFIIGLARNCIELTLMVSLPLFLTAIFVGVIIGIIQAATQIQEMTLVLVPKIIAIFVVSLMAMPWMMDKIITFTRELLLSLPDYIL